MNTPLIIPLFGIAISLIFIGNHLLFGSNPKELIVPFTMLTVSVIGFIRIRRRFRIWNI
jgi:hypothetical protein